MRRVIEHTNEAYDRCEIEIQNEYNGSGPGRKFLTHVFGSIACGHLQCDVQHHKRPEKIVEEVSTMRETERGNRSDDKRSETAMEDRKKDGYF
mgnify:CR=1 FL=1